jgi:hypothetical protein
MKKKLRFIALVGVIASAWSSSEAPSQAVVTCTSLPATCTPGTKTLCYDPQYGELFLCRCPAGSWEC